MLALGQVGRRAGPHHLARGVGDGDGRAGGALVEAVVPVGLAGLQGGVRAGDGDGLADQADGVADVAVLALGDQGLEQVVGEQLLLHPGHLHQLLGEGVGVERRGRVLVLQLRGEQRQEGLVARGEVGLARGQGVLARGAVDGADGAALACEVVGDFDGHCLVP